MCEAMSDMAGELSTRDQADLSALADGTLPEDRRAEVEARVAASPRLQELLQRQRQAVTSLRLLTTEAPPASLRAAVEAHTRPTRRPRFAPKLALATSAAVAAAVIAAVLLSGGPGAPTVADAARLAVEAPNAATPAPAGAAGTRLALAVDGVPFPDLSQFAGWKAVGSRRDRVDGRDATVVYYRKGARRLGYVIVAGAGLPRPEAHATVIRNEAYQTLRLSGRPAVTWRRGGHTCVLLGQATRQELLRLASWPLTPPPR
jgi:anti-sigma factor RsiW